MPAPLERLLEPGVALQVLLQGSPQGVVEGNGIQSRQANPALPV
jgi:hypothetical protein